MRTHQKRRKKTEIREKRRKRKKEDKKEEKKMKQMGPSTNAKQHFDQGRYDPVSHPIPSRDGIFKNLKVICKSHLPNFLLELP